MYYRSIFLEIVLVQMNILDSQLVDWFVLNKSYLFLVLRDLMCIRWENKGCISVMKGILSRPEDRGSQA